MVESSSATLNQHEQLFNSHWLNLIQTAVRIEFLLGSAIESKFTNEIKARKVVGGLAGLIKLTYALDVVNQNTYESLLNFKKFETDLLMKQNHGLN